MNNWFEIKDIGKIQLEVTNFCNAACPLCVREDLHSSDLNSVNLRLDEIKNWFVDGDWINLENVTLTGNVDEPMMNPEIVEICKFFLKLNDKVEVNISTNGGIRSCSLWKKLGELSYQTKRIRVIFGIDGLENTNHIYRRNVQWKKLENNFRAYIQAGGKAIWQFIPFEHNKHEIDAAYDRSISENFHNFKIRESSRSNIEDIIPAKKSEKTKNLVKRKTENTYVPEKKVICAAKPFNSNDYFHKNLASLFINYKGQCLPCCFTGKPERINEFEKQYELDLDSVSLHKKSFEQIFSGQVWNWILSNMQDYKVCIMKCQQKILDRSYERTK